MPPQAGLPAVNAHVPTPKPENREIHEPAARKMEVDEDYSDGGDEESKRNAPQLKSERSSPRSAGAAVPNGPAAHPQTPAVDQKA
jgi:general transcriptional corepressor CYC8